MHAAKRMRNRGFDALGALDALVGRCLHDLVVEGFGPDGVRERRGRPTLIDGGLGSLGLERAQDCRKLRGLRVVEIELEREKSEGTTDAEATRPEVVAAAVASVRSSVPPPGAASKALVGGVIRLRGAGCLTARGVSSRVPPSEHSRMHFLGLLAGARRTQRASGWGNTPHAHAGLATRADIVRRLPDLSMLCGR